jgi:tRNA (guanine37-N1)-methyltransferase
MRVDVITLFPEMIEQAMAFGMPSRALRRSLLQIKCWNPRDFTTDAYRSVDERPYGGGPGMVMLIDPLRAAIAAVRAEVKQTRVIYLSPQGARLTQHRLGDLAKSTQVTLLCGRYEAIDQRLLDACVDEELSLGDFVLSGGELAALAVIDGVARLLPGVLHSELSAIEDSFQHGLLDCPHYTRPEQHELGAVPEVLLSGDHAVIARWRRAQSLAATWRKRPDLLAGVKLNPHDESLLRAALDDYAVKRSADIVSKF